MHVREMYEMKEKEWPRKRGRFMKQKLLRTRLSAGLRAGEGDGRMLTNRDEGGKGVRRERDREGGERNLQNRGLEDDGDDAEGKEGGNYYCIS